MKYYIEIKYYKHSLARMKETVPIKASNSVNAIKVAIEGSRQCDPYCEISEIKVRTKP